jgi:hypothetical protein
MFLPGRWLKCEMVKWQIGILRVKNGNINRDNYAILLRFFTPPPTPPQKGRGVVFYSA